MKSNKSTFKLIVGSILALTTTCSTSGMYDPNNRTNHYFTARVQRQFPPWKNRNIFQPPCRG